jgi:hypothetical protein
LAPPIAPPSGGRFVPAREAPSGSPSSRGKSADFRILRTLAQADIDEGINLRAVGRKSRRIAFEQRLNDQAAQHADKDIRHLGALRGVLPIATVTATISARTSFHVIGLETAPETKTSYRTIS